MVSSSSKGGSSSPPSQPTPAGNLVDYGGTSAPTAWGGAQSVLPNTVTPMTTDLMSQAWQNPNWGTPVGPAPPPADDGGFGNTSYARSLLASMMNPTPANPALAAKVQSMMFMPGFQGSNLDAIFRPAIPKPGAGASPSDQLLYQLAARQGSGGNTQAYTGRSAASMGR